MCHLQYSGFLFVHYVFILQQVMMSNNKETDPSTHVHLLVSSGSHSCLSLHISIKWDLCHVTLWVEPDRKSPILWLSRRSTCVPRECTSKWRDIITGHRLILAPHLKSIILMSTQICIWNLCVEISSVKLFWHFGHRPPSLKCTKHLVYIQFIMCRVLCKTDIGIKIIGL